MAYIKQRKDRGSVWYLYDAQKKISLKTTTKGYAKQLLDKYHRGQLGLNDSPTVKEYYETWIQTKSEPLVRRATIRDYRQHFTCYVLPSLSALKITGISVDTLTNFRALLLQHGMSLKTARNVIDGSFRAMWRDAKLEGLVSGDDPFKQLKWPRIQREKPDPFSVDERDRIIAWFERHEAWYAPYVRWQFETGMRPSETTGLQWQDLDPAECTVTIRRSKNLGQTAAGKTSNSLRRIVISRELMQLVISKRLPWSKDTDPVFTNKKGHGMAQDSWRKDYWALCLDRLNIRHRHFYNARHTAITELIRAGNSPAAVAQYVGNSVTMIEMNYCGRLEVIQPGQAVAVKVENAG